MFLDQQPFVSFASWATRFHVDESKISVQPLAVQAEF